jgi:flagellar L-ring protein precursor FlgH
MRQYLLTVSILGAAGVASAQTTSVPRDRAAEPKKPGEVATRTAQPPAESERPIDAGALLRDHGNSLLKASLAARSDPKQTQLRDVSFTYVPVPEPKVIKKHDLVTIIVREESQFSSDANTETKRDSKIDAAIEDFITFKLKNWEIQGGAVGPTPPKIAGNFNREFKGEGKIDRTDSLTARITAEVLDVKPNGTLVLQARKRIKTDEEEQAFVLTGVCRAEDITADNSILSTQLYDTELSKSHKGFVRNASRKGWGGKLLDLVSPF